MLHRAQFLLGVAAVLGATVAVASHGGSHWPADHRWLDDGGGMACAVNGNTGGPQVEPHVVFSWHDNGVVHLNATGTNVNVPAPCTFGVRFAGATMRNDPNGETPWGIRSVVTSDCAATAGRQCVAQIAVSWWVYFWDVLHTTCPPQDAPLSPIADAPPLKYIEIGYRFVANGADLPGNPGQKVVVAWSCLNPAPGVVPPMPCSKVGGEWVCPGV